MAAIRQAIEKNDVSGVRKLLRSSPKLSSAGFADSSTPLHLAAGNNCPEIVSLLVDAGAKLSDTYSGSGHTALSWAITVGAFKAAIKLARERGQKSFELRAALSLARFLDGQGRRDEARAALADIYGFFTEGHDTADLKTATSLLASLT